MRGDRVLLSAAEEYTYRHTPTRDTERSCLQYYSIGGGVVGELGTRVSADALAKTRVMTQQRWVVTPILVYLYIYVCVYNRHAIRYLNN